MSVIQQLKENEKPVCFTSLEMRNKAKEIGKAEFHWLDPMGDWIPTVDDHFTSGCTYRLRADYEDEPEIEECEILCNDSVGQFYFGGSNGLVMCPLSQVFNNPDFIGFKFEDGSWYDAPIKPVGPDGKLWSGNITVDDIVSGRITILHATHVLFRRKKKE